ncbi:MAG: hypothetical protein LBV47_07445 [Bacteroidales bacterium]|jgi:hypothetical protein|nr:hypothetical protein [Bacteroidales bacterium]
MAKGKKTKTPLATAWQRENRQKYRLPQRGNEKKDEKTSCHKMAKEKKTKTPLATAWQRAKR